MCLIIHKPAGIAVPKWIVESATEYNPDGFGIMAGGKAHKFKSATIAKQMELIDGLQEQECAIHWRMATDGKVNKANAHPFKLANKAYLMHNGVLSKYRTTRDSDKSDTREFIDKFCNVQIAKHGSIPREALLQEILGNAICIMLPDGAISRYGSGWNEYEGMHFSNQYAWDCPTASTYSKYGFGYSRSHKVVTSYADWSDTDTDYIYDDVDGALEYELTARNEEFCNGAKAEQVLDEFLNPLYTVADLLPLASTTHVVYEDWLLQEAVIHQQISEYEFLELCSAKTLYNLFVWAVQKNHIAA